MDLLTLIAQPNRREILRLVWNRERSAGEIADALPVTFGAVSQHLGVLRDAGLVAVRPEGRRRYYRANRDRLGALRPALEALWGDTLDQLAGAIEAGATDATASDHPPDAGEPPA
ncbi:MAG: metalloregulator ArsR/SmtB family transcription factor [Chloroflexi bacterium]|nr:metalloregulator ArsR/SmtB family transcription factor [Chloroflexota bacterium]MDA1003174.1 metalloregulator ArsR/SmtB family transcription factor [Chloroflexota bacterium]MQC27743.1 ArsR family transcriptional regulator [Chloroflexota bacterium]